MYNRLLILTSSTGGGHDMRARALAAWLSAEYGQSVAVKQWQALESSSKIDRFGVSLYNVIQRQLPAAHQIYFNFLEVASLHRGRLLSGPRRRFYFVLKKFQPQLIISVHAHLNHAYFSAARDFAGGPIRCLTYCGELSGGYGFSRHWVNTCADGFIAAVEECAAAAQAYGMPPERTHLGGFLLDPSFFSKPSESRAALRRRLWGVGEDVPVVLLGTGANGANRHPAVLRALASTGLPMTVVALCGRNQATIQRIRQEQNQWPNLSIHPLGYRNDMAHILRSVDVAFIRPGTGTTSECIVSQCPIVFNGLGGLMPQEQITVKFMSGRGIAVEVARTPRQCAVAVERFFADDWRSRVESSREQLSGINPTLHPRLILEEVLR
jgi:processive 1,2-diacylglycerol beta-glucosyltransferase